MAGKQLNVSLLIKAIDQATAPVRAIEQGVTNAIKKIGAAARKSTNDFAEWKHRLEKGEEWAAVAARAKLAADEATEYGHKALEAIARPIEAATEFEHAMTGVSTNVEGTTDQIRQLAEQIRATGKVGQYSTDQISEVAIELGREGMKAGEIFKVLPAIINASIATGSSLGETTETATRMWEAFGVKADDIPGKLDMITKAATSTSAKVPAIGEALSRAAVQAGQFKTGVTSLTAEVVALAGAGFHGRRGSTALAELFDQLAAPQARATKTLHQFSVQTSVDGKLRDPGEIATELFRKTAALGKQKQTLAFANVFGTTGGNAALALGNAGASGEMEETRKRLDDSAGLAQRRATQLTQDAQGATDALNAAMHDLNITLGSELTPMIKSLGDWLKGLIGWIGDAARNHSMLTKAVLIGTGAFGLLASAIGLTLGMLSVLASGLSVANIALGGTATGAQLLKAGLSGIGSAIRFVGFQVVKLGVQLMTVLIPLLPLIAAVTLLALAVYLVYRNWTPIKAFFKELFTDTRGTVSDFLAWMVDTFKTALHGIAALIRHPLDSLEKLKEALPSWAGGGLPAPMLVATPSARSQAAAKTPQAATAPLHRPAIRVPPLLVSTTAPPKPGLPPSLTVWPPSLAVPSVTLPPLPSMPTITVPPAVMVHTVEHHKETITEAHRREEQEREEERKANEVPASTPSPAAPQKISGELAITINSEGRPRVSKLKSQGIQISVETGRTLSGGG